MSDDRIPHGLGAPASRALADAGLTTLSDVADCSEPELMALHGMGAKAVARLRAALARTGRGFRPPDPLDDGSVAVDRYLAEVTGSHLDTLTAIRSTLRTLLPHAHETIAYGMPAMSLHGEAVAGYAVARSHCTYAPMSGSVVSVLGDALDGYERSKGALRIPRGERLPVGIIRALVAARLAELGDVADGIRHELHKDGRVKAEGWMRNGQLHGDWAWYRADGSLMRTGSFRLGEKVGEWQTFARPG